ncbi:MAG: LVIVD repeat-containing protein [Micromonosporaceae bacterium]
MRSTRAVLSVAATVLLVGAWSPAASADHNADEHSGNAKHLANIPRSSEVALGGPSFQSDLAFTGKYAIAGNYNGFRVIDITNPANPTVVRDVWCPGPQNDVSIWGDALVLSVDTVLTSSSCTAARAVPQTLETGWEGLRVFSLAEVLATAPDPDGFTRLEPAAAIYTACGSHTHTGVPDGNRVLIYVSSYSLRSGPDCGPHDDPSDTHNPVHMKISIAEVLPNDPAGSHFVKTSPIDMPVFTDLVPFGFNPLGGCHDMQAYPSKGLLAAACASVGQLWDISDPENPQSLDPLWQVDEPDVQFYHSAAFTWDANVVIFGDEVVFESNCSGPQGQIWFHGKGSGDTLGSFQIPRAQPEEQYCSAHIFHVLKTNPGEYRLVSSWYSGGVTVVDFTDPAQATEVAYYDPAPPPGDNEGLWSAYAYNGFVYSNGLFRGFDSYFIAPARAGGKKLTTFNPQTQ